MSASAVASRLGRAGALAVVLLALATPAAPIASPSQAETVGACDGGDGPAAPTHLAAVAEVHFAMATPIAIVARAADEPAARRAARAAFAEIRRLESIVSTFDAASDASRVNRSAGGAPAAVASELVALVRDASRLAAATRGTFSILVGPLVDLWRDASVRGGAPEGSALAAARDLARPELLRVEGARVGLARAGMRLDVGGLAKGFAADRALDVLRSHGARSAIVNLGGSSIAAYGDDGSGEAGWGVELPALAAATAAAAGTAPAPTLRLCAAALSTSAPRPERERPGYIVDPRSGALLSDDRVAVALHRSATDAEALSKALLLLGADAGAVLAAEEAEGVVIAADGRALCSGGFRSLAPGCTVLRPAQLAPRRRNPQR